VRGAALVQLRDDLDAIIDAFLAGRTSYSEFHNAVWGSLIHRAAEWEEFTPEESDHYGAVNEKQEWTADSPDDESRKYGWIDPSELRAWLSVHEMVKPPRKTSV
jgi:hypothetical protein